MDQLTHEAWQQLTSKNGDLCDEWKDFDTFLAGAGPRKAKEYRLVKVNPAAKYEPGNTKWILPGGCFEVDGKIYRLNYPGVEAKTAMDKWIIENRRSPLQIAKDHLEGLTPEQQTDLLKAAFAQEKLIVSSVSGVEFMQALDSQEGGAIMAYYLFRKHHPEVTKEQAYDLIMHLTSDQFEEYKVARDSLPESMAGAAASP